MLKVSGDEIKGGNRPSSLFHNFKDQQTHQKKDPSDVRTDEKLIPDRDMMKEAVEQAEKVATAFSQNLRFEYREEADMYQVLVLKKSQDLKKEDEVIRKIPADEVVNFLEHVKDMFGALLDIEA